MWIYGVSGFCKVILDCLIANGEQVDGFVDDDSHNSAFMGYPVVRINKLFFDDVKMVVGIGENNTRKAIAERLNVRFETIIHPSAVVSPMSTLEKGTVVFPQAVINAGSHIGEHCIINTKASVSHDCNIGDFVHIAPGTTICGNVSIGPLSWIGAGATIIQDLQIGRNVMIGAGCVVVNNIQDNAFVLGIPGRVIKFQNEL
jgi:sugar O-acyltransferase (sialic acid O-acetyltransferase NeuD family)